MNELKDSKRALNGPAAKNVLTASAVVAALAGGYALRGTQVTAQQTDPNASTKTPIVQTPATTDAASMQKAFNEVSNAIEPAVVTVTTRASARPASATSPRGRMQPFGGGEGGGANPFGGGGEDPFEEFFRQFRRFQPNGWQPNAMEKEALRARFYEVQGGRGGGLGSGMIYREDGYIITNAHVVKDASTVTIKLNDGREFKDAKVVGSDERTDVAVVKINSTAKLPTVRLGDSSNVKVGDWAIAVGNPFGLEHTVTVGVISAKAREVPLSERNPGDYLQTDASINPGNSGGPLCDIYGRVIGINNAIYSQSGGNVGIGFAIPVNVARNIADRLVQSPNHRITRSYLGVSITGVEDAQTAAGLDLDPSVRGVLIQEVTDANTPGAKAGLQPGDVVTEFNGQKVTRSIELQRLVGDAPVGSTATIKVLRGGAERTLTARLEELKDENAARPSRSNPTEEPDDASSGTTVQGMQLRPASAQLAERFGLKNARGVIVTAVDENSAAAEAGVQPGDIIERVGQTPVASPTEVKTAIERILKRQSGADKSVGVYVNRGGQKRFFFIEAR